MCVFVQLILLGAKILMMPCIVIKCQMETIMWEFILQMLLILLSLILNLIEKLLDDVQLFIWLIDEQTCCLACSLKIYVR